jgi:large subunit ribosomal protein L16
MALAPARTKYRKSQKGSRAGNAKRGNTLAFGEFGLQSLTPRPDDRPADRGRPRHDLPAPQAQGQALDPRFPAQAVTKKPAEVRMGQGKGPVEFYVAVIKPGAVLFELAGVPPVSPRRPSASPTPSCPSTAVSSSARAPSSEAGTRTPTTMTAKEIRDLSPVEITTKIRETRERSSSCACASRPARSRRPTRCAPSARTSPASRPSCARRARRRPPCRLT